MSINKETTKVIKRAPQAVTPPGTEGPSINAGIMNRLLVISATKLFHSFKKNRAQGCVKLPYGLIVKASTATKVTEAHTVRFVAANTNIPVPKIYCAFTRRRTGKTYIVQSMMDGEPLGKGWMDRSEESKARLLADLRAKVDQLRSIKPPPGTGVHDICGGAMWDVKVSWTNPMGPFASVDEFHLWLRNGWDPIPAVRDMPERDPPGFWDYENRIVKMHQSREFQLKFTHADLNWTNILVHGDKVTAIIDWCTSGWYPDYWEYARLRIDTVGNHTTQEYADRFLDTYSSEYTAESYRTGLMEH